MAVSLKQRTDEAFLAEEVNSAKIRNWTTGLFYLVAASLLVVGFMVAFGKTPEANGRVAMYLFAASAGVILAHEFIYLLPKLIKLKVAGVDIEIANEVKNLKEQVSDIVTELIEAQGAGTSAKLEAAKLAEGEPG